MRLSLHKMIIAARTNRMDECKRQFSCIYNALLSCLFVFSFYFVFIFYIISGAIPFLPLPVRKFFFLTK